MKRLDGLYPKDGMEQSLGPEEADITTDAYMRLGSAILREVLRDVKGGPRGENRSRYFSAVGFLRSPLFEMICEVQGVDVRATKRHILKLSSTKELPVIRSKNKWQPKRKFYWVWGSRKVVN